MTSLRVLFVVILGLFGCVKKEPLASSGKLDAATLRAIRTEGVAVAPVVALQDLPAPPIAHGPSAGEIEQRLLTGEEHLAKPTVLDPNSPRDAAFLRNEYFGNIRFGGGFIRTGEVALDVRARIVELGFEDAWRADGMRWVEAMIPRVLDAADVRLGPVGPAVAPVPERVRHRGLHPEDGTDNVNLPRYELVPTALSEAERAAAASWPWLLVPYLRLYYAHNGGWFLGQTSGCMAGARVEAFVVIYDTRTGRPVWHATTVGRHIQPRVGQASSSELEQYVLWAEGYAEERLVRGFLK